MSGSPDKQSVRELKDLAKQARAAYIELQSARHVAQTIKPLEQHFCNLQTKIVKLMQSMDCKSTGNAGYENRLMSLLMNLDEAYSQES